MKLVRYGKAGKEKPGLIDEAGKLRDLSEVIVDIDADTLGVRALARLMKLKPQTLPAVRGAPRIGPCVAGVRNFIAVGLNYADHAANRGTRSRKSRCCSTKPRPASSAPMTTSWSPKDRPSSTGKWSSPS